MYAVLKDHKEGHLSFVVVGCTTSLANALRRVMVANIETWAIEEVRFKRNTTVLTDEFIAHRLGLIPLKGDCDDEEAHFTFSKVAGEGVEEWCSGDMEGELEIPIENIPIVKACKGQVLEFKAVAKRGCGKEHAKWSPVSTCTFRKVDEGYLFVIETVYSMEPGEVLKEAIKVLREKVELCMDSATVQSHEP